MSQVRSEEETGFAAAFRNQRPVWPGQSAILHPIIVDAQIQVTFRQGTKVEALAPPSLAQDLSAEFRVHPVRRRPIIRIADYKPIDGIISNLGQQKARLAHLLARRYADIRQVNEGHLQQSKIRPNQDDLLINFESGADRIE